MTLIETYVGIISVGLGIISVIYSIISVNHPHFGNSRYRRDQNTNNRIFFMDCAFVAVNFAFFQYKGSWISYSRHFLWFKCLLFHLLAIFATAGPEGNRMRLRRAGVIYSDLIATFFASRPLINCACSKLKRIIYQSVNKTLRYHHDNLFLFESCVLGKINIKVRF